MRVFSCADRFAPVAVVILGLVACDTTLQQSLAPSERPSFDHTSNPTQVTVAGSLQSELGCTGDWQPECNMTSLTAEDDVWQATFDVPAGAYEYKAALNAAWDENYGANATQGGANIALTLASATSVKFYYSHQTHWITSSANSVIATAAGSFQSELGCSSDWDAGCLRSWLQDPDGNGVYTFSTTALVAGSYEAKVPINESWAENYGANGVANGDNIPFTVLVNAALVSFSYNASTHVLTITVAGSEPSFGGFISPISGEDWNTVKGGQTVRVPFTLGGDFGLNVFDTGYPKSLQIDCETEQPIGSASSAARVLQYSAQTGEYTYMWKTERGWSGTCRLFVLKFGASAEYGAKFILR